MTQTLTDYLQRHCRSTAVLGLLTQLADCARRISDEVARGSLASHHAASGSCNVHGEQQQSLDVLANQVILEAAANCDGVAGFASEELEHPQRLARAGELLVVVDPLDGSSNIAINAPVGTIFSVLRAHGGDADTSAAFLQPGQQQLAAGYAIYGPSTELVITLEQGVDRFTLERGSDRWLLSATNLRIPPDTSEYAINAANARLWEAPVARYVAELVAGSSGPRQRDFNTRWIASLVSDVHRLLTRGGIFMYPMDERIRTRGGRLRLLYECNPVSLLIERAGGLASTGSSRILELRPSSLHQRVPLIMGSRNEVARLDSYHAAAEPAAA